ncbi:MAG: O-methyltransferase [Planctomycetaceae bacterium]|nr:O-methyltransferase [Planctomycetaceae bacterium]
MSAELWNQVDRYFIDALLPSDPVLEAAVAASAAAELPPISVSPAQGKFLHLLARITNARNILEIGTLGGYSTIWLARALPSHGRLLTLEADPRHAEVALANIERAGLSEIVELRRGLAMETLPRLASEGLSPFDLIFIDADKESTPEYFDWAIQLSRPGTVIVVDNVVRNGAVIDPHSDDTSVQGIRRFMERIATDTRVTATALQTVGSKGYDGFAIAVVNDDRFS